MKCLISFCFENETHTFEGVVNSLSNTGCELEIKQDIRNPSEALMAWCRMYSEGLTVYTLHEKKRDIIIKYSNGSEIQLGGCKITLIDIISNTVKIQMVFDCSIPSRVANFNDINLNLETKTIECEVLKIKTATIVEDETLEMIRPNFSKNTEKLLIKELTKI